MHLCSMDHYVIDVDRENENPDPVCEAGDGTDHLNSLDRERKVEPLCEREQESVTSCSSASVSCTASTGNAPSHLGQSTLLQQYLAKEVGQQDRYHYKWDGAFCFACRQFHRPGGNRGEKAAFSNNGFWK